MASVNGAEVFAFDRTGKKPIAPLGYHYFPVSIRPYVEELEANGPKKKGRAFGGPTPACSIGVAKHGASTGEANVMPLGRARR